MKVEDLVETLLKLPQEAEIYVDVEGENLGQIGIEPVRDDDEKIVGYIIFDDKQLDLPLKN